uniref:Transposase IS200-like domain-containing protein n=1 Tax=candidate division WOR-3 bacterium TaxID=2052148 RepID=A0A7C4XLJ5_UNCW3
MRKIPLINGQIYHIFSKSIAGFRVFRNKREYERFIEMVKFYRHKSVPVKFSAYEGFPDRNSYYEKKIKSLECLVQIIAYCIMPTHFHLVLKQLLDNGITIFLKNLLDSYTRYFNLKNERKGPLWQGRFKSVLVDNNVYLLHLTRYIHLNPVVDNLVGKPEDWYYSSYREYIHSVSDRLCSFSEYIDLKPEEYKEFVEIRKDYLNSIKEINHLILE